MKRRAAKRNNWLGLLAGLICLLALIPCAHAANLGNLRVNLEGAGTGMTVTLCRAAERDGTLAGSFSGAEVTPEQLLTESNRPYAAALLYEYAAEQGVTGAVQIADADGVVNYTELEEGIYLLWGESKNLRFEPFLVSIPTVVGETEVYDVEAKPKTDEPGPPEETQPPETIPPETTPPEGEVPNIPQTGVNIWPICILMGLGILALGGGIVMLCRRPDEEDHSDEEENEEEE